MKTTFTLIRQTFYFLICVSMLSIEKIHAQNWECIPSNDTNYFRVSTIINDTMIDGYLRSIHSVSTTTNMNIKTNILPFSTRNNAFGIIDTFTGHSWLGKVNMVNILTGENIFVNVLSDTILIKTHATLNNTWIMAKDTNGNDFLATISSMDTMTLDGQLDSIKVLNIQAYNGLSPIASIFNSIPIIISKNHGFVTTTEFYHYPNVDSPYTSSGIYPKLQYPHHRIDKNYTQLNIREIDFNSKYKPGNEWIQYKWTYGGYQISHDSIINSFWISPTKISVTRYNHRFDHYIISNPWPPHDTSHHTYSTQTDTLTTDTLVSRIAMNVYEQPNASALTGPYTSPFKLVNFHCNEVSLKDSGEMHTPLSGNQIFSHRYQSKFGERSNYHYFFDGVNFYHHFLQTLYLKLDSCVEGTKFNFKSLSLHDMEKANSLLQLYPNPSIDKLEILNPTHIPIESYAILDMTGKVLLQGKYSSAILITPLPSGLYLLELKTKQGKVTRKFLKQ